MLPSDTKSTREKALEFAKNVPKPRQRRPSNSGSEVPAVEGGMGSGGAAVPDKQNSFDYSQYE